MYAARTLLALTTIVLVIVGIETWVQSGGCEKYSQARPVWTEPFCM
ncbi:MAG: hypothetical protein MI867_08895 [Pseudomonadales bacterium]|nr:hypothetical protein [Pseudomonadales bacterium]